mmetsp:Transcript_65854/g.157387  ORF Transcript_65854/g.157387 Transcript_65854/m.157387 type:complete len:546 (-) Transcript_65854:54-1691(-)
MAWHSLILMLHSILEKCLCFQRMMLSSPMLVVYLLLMGYVHFEQSVNKSVSAGLHAAQNLQHETNNASFLEWLRGAEASDDSEVLTMTAATSIANASQFRIPPKLRGSWELQDTCHHRTCAGFTCDYWYNADPSRFTCARLQKHWGCDCTGCASCSRPKWKGGYIGAPLVRFSEVQYPNARCLDGSMAGIYWRQGDTKQFVVYFEGGGWCYAPDCYNATTDATLQNCRSRSKTYLGSSQRWPSRARQSWERGYLSEDCQENPVFCGWTVIYLPYCDGAGFVGDAEVGGLHFRGKAIVEAAISKAMDMGMRLAQKVVLTGGSAGATAVLHLADQIRDQLALGAGGEVLALPDAGFFLDVPDVSGKLCWQNQMRSVYELANACPNLHKGCRARYPHDPCKCIYPEYYADLIETPTFVVQSLYDTSEMWYTLVLKCCPPDLCGKKPRWPTCGKADMKRFNAMRDQHIHAWAPLVRKRGNGVWADGCPTHTQMEKLFTSKWYQVPMRSGRTMSHALQQWLHDRDKAAAGRDVWEDAPWPANTECAYYLR